MAAKIAPHRVAVVGAGAIAAVHLQVLRHCRGAEVVAVCDPAIERARSLARQHDVTAVYGSLDELIAAGRIDVAHVLVPPDVHHEVARTLLAAGIAVYVEKPLAMTTAEVRELEALASEHGLALGVNHTMVCHPAFERLSRAVKAGHLGRLEHLALLHNVPLRQLDAGDVSHFMFQAESHILLEQGVHPFSMVQRLLGRSLEVSAWVEAPRRLVNGAPFYDSWSIAMRCERGSAQVRLAFGRDLEESTVHAIGTDGAMRIDLRRSTAVQIRKTRWLDFGDTASNGLANGARLAAQGLAVAADYVLGLFRLRRYPDAFTAAMGASIERFHRAYCAAEVPPCGAAEAFETIEMCERTAVAAGVSSQRFAPYVPAAPGPVRAGEVMVTGATGFLGRHLVAALRAAGRPLTVLVRRPQLLPEWLRDPHVRVFAGDARDAEAVRAAVAGADCVIHMATCAAGSEIEASMREGLRVVSEACLDHDVRRLVFTSSTAALYLGADGVITGAAPPDPRPARRAEYARGKIAAEHELARLQRERGLRAVTVRPAIVLGRGGIQNHSGVGLWVRDNRCVGWGMGSHPLPLVLARDCAGAIVRCLDAGGIDGRSYNLAGDVRLSASEYVSELKRRSGRDYHFHPQPLWSIALIERAKWLIKLVARRPREWPASRDFHSRAFLTRLDCSDVVADLDWHPEADRERFLAEALVAATDRITAATEPRNNGARAVAARQ